MKVKELMVREVRSCLMDDSLSWAARLMWEGDFGVLPVLGPDGSVVGMITDRDICMAAYIRGSALAFLRVGNAMAKQVAFCSPDSTLETAMSLMKEARVHRLPVVDSQGKLAGILSLNDLAREARRLAKGSGAEVRAVDVADTLGVLCEHRLPAPVVTKSRGTPVGKLAGAGV